MKNPRRTRQALDILAAMGFPRGQQNERSALCLLALLDMAPGRKWADAAAPLRGVTPIMDWVHRHYGKRYAPNTRETVRRQTLHQFVQSGMVLHNPDNPARPVNSPKAVYQIASDALKLLRAYSTPDWSAELRRYLAARKSLSVRYARERFGVRVPLRIAPDRTVRLSPGKHSRLVRAVVEEFAPCFVPGGELIYVGDTGRKWAYFDEPLLSALGVSLQPHGKMPDLVLHDRKRRWLLLVECVTSHGPMDAKRHAELATLFSSSAAGLVYVTAFPDRATLTRHIARIAWETEVWVADAPTHLIHFNGERFLGPHAPR